MRCVEITAALIAETLIELGVSIVTQPEEIHWPNGTVSKAPEPGKKKKGGKKNEKKNKHGIFGQIVSDLAPKLPKEKSTNNLDSSKLAETASSAIKKPKATSARSKSNAGKKTTSQQEEADFEGQHEGLPVQGRKCKCMHICCLTYH